MSARPPARRARRLNRPGRALLLRELRRRRGTLARIALWSLAESVPALLSGLLISAALDRFLARDVTAGVAALTLLLVAAAAGAVATYRVLPMLAAIVEPVRDAFVTAVVEGAIATSVRSAARPDAARVAQLTEQVHTVRNILFALLRSARQVVFTSLAALIGLALIAPLAALVTGALMGVSLTLFALLLRRLVGRQRAVLLAEEEVARRGGEVFGGLRDAIACAAEDRAAGEVGHAVQAEAAVTRELARTTVLRSPLVFLGGQLPLVVLLAAAPWLLRGGHLTVAELVGAATYLTVRIEPALRGLFGTMGAWGIELVVTLDRLGEGFAEPDPLPEETTSEPSRYDLRIRDLTFAHGPHAAAIFRSLDLTVPEGEHIAVVGPSGIGKSTLANLLIGLLSPQHGSVHLGGADIQGGARDLRRVLALIPQEAYVFAGTLRDNLTYLAPDATDRDVARAAQAVGLGHVIEHLGGLGARVGAGGADLSAGEKQLIALTRVHLSPARIVILDEATSSLDPTAEARAETAFAERGGTLIVIAHRISSARRAGRIMLLDGHGVVVGGHEELLSASALYADLVGHWEEAPRGTPQPDRV
ncbi:ABC transporter ATP-binding protein [Sphaerisporangium sp. NPDC051011]|uniref:ABC transporter ATP-binding protein n=1 Tax=Sphaerisporangium sp. NPDC051011 TaxID=3155792 RepID=UPI00340A916A